MADAARVFHDLVRVETALWNAVDAALREHCGLTLARFETLEVIGRRRPCRVQDVADELLIGWSGASKIVDRLAADGLCRRRPNPDDARSSHLVLTARGRGLLHRAAARHAAELDTRFGAALTAPQLEALRRALTLLRTTGGDRP